MFGVRKVNEKSLQVAFQEIGRRGTVFAPVQILIHWLMAVRPADEKSTGWMMLGFAALVLSLGGRTALWIVRRRIFARQNGLLLYRVVYCSLIACNGASWGMTAAVRIYQSGLSTNSFMIMFSCLVISAAAPTSFNIEIVGGGLYQIGALAPAAIVALLRGGTYEIVFAIGVGVYLAFILMAGLGFARFRGELWHQKDIIGDQKVALDSMGETVHAVYESIDQAFLIFDQGGNCTGETSRRSKELFGIEPSGKHITEILRVPEERKATISAWYRLLFEERMDFKELAELGPKTLEIPPKDQARGLLISLKFNPTRPPNSDKIHAITLVATDVTREKQAEKTADEARERATLILRIHERPEGFRSFLKQMETTLDRLMRWNGNDLPSVRRDLHTLKGTAAIFSAMPVMREINETELAIKERLNSADASDAADPEFIRSCGVNLNRRYFAWRSREIELFTQLGVFEENHVEISRPKLAELASKLARDTTSSAVYRSIINDLLSTEFGDLIKDLESHIQTTAERLGKKVDFRVEAIGQPINVSDEAYRDVLRSLLHFFNDTLDHGIESPAERQVAGKPERGLIWVRYEEHSEDERRWIRMHCEDDGRGIGMGSVRSEILNAGGRVRIAKTSPQGTAFEVLLPLHVFDAHLSIAS